MNNGKQYGKQEQLQNLLRQHAKILLEEAIQSKGQIAESELEKLERLSRLAEIDKIVSPPPRVRWPVILLLAVTLTIVSLLLFARVSSTEIELDLVLSEVSFRLPEQQVLSEDMRLSCLGVSGIKEIHLPRSENKEAQVLQTTDSLPSAIRLTPELINKQEASVTLGGIILPAAAQVTISPAENTQQFILSLKADQLDIRAGINGHVAISRPGTPAEIINFLTPKSIILKSGPENIDVDVNLLPNTKSKFTRQLHADSLSLFRVDEHISASQTIIHRISTIQSGTLYFESLGGIERKLRPGQEIRFEFSEGDIRTIEIKEGHIAFAFHGRVKGMTTGSSNNHISIMPTYLEWLSARHGLSLLWGTSLYIFGIIFSIWRWWGASS